MFIDFKETKVYIISPGEDKYRDRVLTVFTRLVDDGYKHIVFFKSVPGLNRTASLTNTVLEIFNIELGNHEPFIILEDDCAIFTKYNKMIIPDNTDALYLGMSSWAYPYSINTLYKKQRPNILYNNASIVESHNEHLTKIKGLTGGHAILFNSRDYMKMFINVMNDIAMYVDDLPHDLLFSTLQPLFNIYGLKKPMFYQDKTLGGQEDVTKIVYDEGCYRKF